jgi:hypothetical protein
MILESQIISRLKTIDQYHFERLIVNLLYQGAYPNILPRNSFIESFGNNPEKERTTKSAPHADSEFRLAGIKVEESVREDWKIKIKEDVEKHKGEEISKFAFFTNQEIGDKAISNDEGGVVDAVEYCKKELGCAECFIIGRGDLLLPLQNEGYFYIRRNFLALPGDYFITPSSFLHQIRINPFLSTEVDDNELKKHSREFEREVIFSPGKVIVLHNEDYITLLHALGLWAQDQLSEQEKERIINMDYSFINWPRADLGNIDDREIDDDTSAFIFVWGAHEIQNASEYLKFFKSKTTMVFVTKTSFKETVISRLQSFGKPVDIQEVSVKSIDQREISVEELNKHEAKIKSLVKETMEILLRLEALIFFYSPLNAKDRSKINKIERILKISSIQFVQLREMLLKNDLIALTGDIIWLKQPGVVKSLLNDYINKDIFKIDELV